LLDPRIHPCCENLLLVKKMHAGPRLYRDMCRHNNAVLRAASCFIMAIMARGNWHSGICAGQAGWSKPFASDV